MAHNNWRFFDNPLVGSWRHLPDDLSLQRGPTIVILPDGRRIRVPAMSKRNVQAPGDHHSAKDGEDILKSLHALLQGKKEKNHPGPLHMGRRRVGDHPQSRRRPYRRGHAAGAASASRWRSSAQLSLLEHQRAILLEHILFCSQKHFVIRRKWF